MSKQKYKSEHELQCVCVKYFRVVFPRHQWHLFAIPNGGLRNIRVAQKLKREGVLSGVWDMFLAIPNRDKHGLFIEMKHGYNKLTDNQKEFKKAIGDDYDWAVVYTLDEFRECIGNYLRKVK